MIKDGWASKETLEMSTEDFSISLAFVHFVPSVLVIIFYCRAFWWLKPFSEEFDFVPVNVGFVRRVVYLVT